MEMEAEAEAEVRGESITFAQDNQDNTLDTIA